MANFLLHVPSTLRSASFAISASSNGSVPGVAHSGGPLVLELPLDKIRRPLMRTRQNDPQKVQELMDSITQVGLQVPIDVLEVDGVYYGEHLVQLTRNASVFSAGVFLVATVTRLTSALGFQLSVAKFAEELKKI